MSTADGSRSRLMRTRWAAIGAAVAVTVGAGGLYTVGATSPSSSFVAIAPVRVLDTRSDVGLSGPFTSDIARKLDVTSTDPSPVPDSATGIVANVTVVTPSTPGFVSVRPGDATGLPSTSSVNFGGGQIRANSVTVELPTTGAHAGAIDLVFHGTAASATADLLIDIVGYYQPATAGAPGPQGPAGERGPSAWDVIPSGQTVTGELVYTNGVKGGNTNSEYLLVPLPGRAPVELDDEHVNFALGGDADSDCDGTVDAPSAPAGMVCLYLGNATDVGGVGFAAVHLPDRGFLVEVTFSGTNSTPYFEATWAYTAP